jgi:hypothetical protein
LDIKDILMARSALLLLAGLFVAASAFSFSPTFLGSRPGAGTFLSSWTFHPGGRFAVHAPHRPGLRVTGEMGQLSCSLAPNSGVGFVEKKTSSRGGVEGKKKKAWVTEIPLKKGDGKGPSSGVSFRGVIKKTIDTQPQASSRPRSVSAWHLAPASSAPLSKTRIGVPPLLTAVDDGNVGLVNPQP